MLLGKLLLPRLRRLLQQPLLMLLLSCTAAAVPAGGERFAH
jgi:hypothetical protein